MKLILRRDTAERIVAQLLLDASRLELKHRTPVTGQEFTVRPLTVEREIARLRRWARQLRKAIASGTCRVHPSSRTILANRSTTGLKEASISADFVVQIEDAPDRACDRAESYGSARDMFRRRAPVASAMPLAIAAAVGPCAASPVPRKGVPG
jgi:hypothetical protein